MKIETDLKVIQEVSEIKEEQNYRFRSYLKNMNMSGSKLDKIVHSLYKEISAQIDCTKCANCCNVTITGLEEKDVKKFASGLKQNCEEFKAAYLVNSVDGEKEYEFKTLPCPFLKDNKCINYNYRPKECKEYPHLHKNEFSSRLFGVVSNYRICPIVFNVYEQLKEIFWNKNRYY